MEWLKKYGKIVGFVVGGLFLLSIIFYVGNSFPRQSVLDQYLKKQEEELTKKFDEQMALKNSEIDSLNFQLNKVQEQYSGLKTSYAKLKKEKENVVKPQSKTDTVNRLKSLGYTSVK
jgi:chromosome segregation ATPase